MLFSFNYSSWVVCITFATQAFYFHFSFFQASQFWKPKAADGFVKFKEKDRVSSTFYKQSWCQNGSKEKNSANFFNKASTTSVSDLHVKFLKWHSDPCPKIKIVNPALWGWFLCRPLFPLRYGGILKSMFRIAFAYFPLWSAGGTQPTLQPVVWLVCLPHKTDWRIIGAWPPCKRDQLLRISANNSQRKGGLSRSHARSIYYFPPLYLGPKTTHDIPGIYPTVLAADILGELLKTRR